MKIQTQDLFYGALLTQIAELSSFKALNIHFMGSIASTITQGCLLNI